jgi:CheY-specific phosphatase CheX
MHETMTNDFMLEIINRVVREQTNEIQEMIEEVVQEIANAASFFY